MSSPTMIGEEKTKTDAKAAVDYLQLRHDELTQRVTRLRQDIDRFTKELTDVEGERGSIENLLSRWRVNGSNPTSHETQESPTMGESLPLPKAIETILREAGGSLTHKGIQAELVQRGFTAERLGKKKAYYYATISRLVKTCRIEKIGDGYGIGMST